MRRRAWASRCSRLTSPRPRRWLSSTWRTKCVRGLTMKKSELKLLQEKLQKVSQPPPSKKRDDLSDELSKMFDDGTLLESEKGARPQADISPATETPATLGTMGTQGSRGLARPSPPAAAPQPVAPARDYMKVANSI